MSVQLRVSVRRGFRLVRVRRALVAAFAGVPEIPPTRMARPYLSCPCSTRAEISDVATVSAQRMYIGGNGMLKSK